MRAGSSRRDAHWADLRSQHGGVDEIPLPEGLSGRLWLCGKRFIAPDPEAALAYIEGDAVVCLNEPHELEWYPDYIEWLKRQPPERVLWCRIPDLHVPPVEQTLDLLGELRSRLELGQRLLMHCGAGIGRAGTIAAALLITAGETPESAVAHLRAHRSLCGPEAGPQTELLDWLFKRYRSEDQFASE